jgi:hypothetical protein
MPKRPSEWPRSANAERDAAGPLFDSPNARPTDPGTSIKAGEAHEASGEAGKQRTRILNWMKAHCSQSSGTPQTSSEIAHHSGFDRYVVARRLPEMERLGLVKRGPERRCTYSGHDAIAWTATEGTA